MNNTRAYLISDRARHAYPIGPKTLTIGRDSVSHVVVTDPSVSRFHAEVRVDSAGRKPVYTFHSMGARGSGINGTTVNGPRALDEGDEIVVGDTVLRFTRADLPAEITVVQLTDAPADTTVKATQVNRSIEPITAEPLAPRRGLFARLLGLFRRN